MRFRNLGDTGLKVSEVGLGCNNFGMRVDASGTAAVVHAALDCGINFFDTADYYGKSQSEVFLGQALGKRRSEVVIATKFGLPMGDSPLTQGASRRYVMRAAEASLKRLNTDYIDLYQIHFPDPETPIQETLGALSDLVHQGKVRYIGCSNFSGWQLADADWTASAFGFESFVCAQNQYSLLDRRVEKEVIPACEHFGLGLLPYFPLASGLLTGKYQRNHEPPQGTRLSSPNPGVGTSLSDAKFDRVEALAGFAEEREHTLLQLAFCWLLSQPVISSVIAGATSAGQVQSNVAAAKDWRLQAEEMQVVAEISRHSNRRD